jgi:hypothetical protein
VRIVRAEPRLVERALAGSHVDRVPVPPESSYFGELLRALRMAVLKALLRGAEMLHVPRNVLIAGAVLAAIAALVLLLRAVLPRERRRRSQPGTVVAAGGPAPADFDAAGWRAELERRLAAGRTVEALEAAWWWLARSLAGSRALPDWTSRDLLLHARRPGLAGPLRRLDALTYGPREPSADDLRNLVAGLEEGLS